MFPFAPQPDIIRSQQKDEYTVNKLREEARDIAHYVLGHQIGNFDQEIELFVSCTYYGMLMLGKKTLGEEYCDLLPISAAKKARNSQVSNSSYLKSHTIRDSTAVLTNRADLPVSTSPPHISASNPDLASQTPNPSLLEFTDPNSIPNSLTSTSAPTSSSSQSASKFPLEYLIQPLTFANRRHLFVLQILFPYLYLKLIRYCHRRTSSTRNFAQKIISTLIRFDVFINTFLRLHQILFYLTGEYWALSKRTLGIRYVLLRQIEGPAAHYSSIGMVALIHMTGEVILALHNYYKQREQNRLLEISNSQAGPSGSSESTLDSQFDHTLSTRPDLQDQNETDPDYNEDEATKCSLCLCPMTAPTSIECGHLYCWECITPYLKQKSECPLCRQYASLTTLITLAHYY